MIRQFFAFFLSLLFLSSCGVNPVTGKRELHLIGEATEVNMGEKNYLAMQQAQGGQYVADPKVSSYVSQVGKKLAEVSDRPHLPYEFVVLNESVPNAWALPGGKIAVNRGLLVELDSEGELAAVLGHEIVHAAARHTAQRMQQGVVFQAGLIGVATAAKDHKYKELIGGTSQVLALLLTQKYSRGHELEADHYGMKYMLLAGYDTNEAISLQQTFVRLHDNKQSNWMEGLFATHPPSQERVKENRKTAAILPKGDYVGKEAYHAVMAHLKKTNGAYDDYERGVAALQKGDVKEALKWSSKALEIEPREGLFYALQGKAYAFQGNKKQALSAFDQAIRLNDWYYDFYLQRGLLKETMHRWQEAKKDLEKSVYLLPTAEAHNALGNLNLHFGKRNQAIEHFEKAAGSDSSAGKRARQILSELEKNTIGAQRA